MQSRHSVYGLILTYSDDKVNFSPSEYKRTCDSEILGTYKQITKKHLNALLQSVRRHKKTKLGENWNGWILTVSSCLNRKKSPDRLHIHLLIEGSPGSTIGNYITSYWKKRFGLVNKQKYEDNAVADWMEKYFLDQKLIKRKLII